MSTLNFKNLILSASKRYQDIPIGSLPMYVIGRNEESKFLIRKYPIEAIIDDYNGTPFFGIPSIKMEVANKNAIILNCSSSIWPVSVVQKLSTLNFTKIFDLGDIYSNKMFSNHHFFIDDAKKSVVESLESWKKLYSSMSDTVSRSTLEDILLYRLSGSVSYMRHFSNREKDQYFESFIPRLKYNFVDAGSYDGYTSKYFINYFDDYESVMIFEPSQKNFKITKESLASYENIKFYNYGLGSEEKELRFSEGGSSSKIDNKGGLVISIKPLDDFCIQSANYFVKMDLEGSELDALKGAKNIIKSGNSVFAVAVYHSINDFINIFEYMNSFGVHYNIHLRHYTEGWSETVMFFIPSGLISDSCVV